MCLLGLDSNLNPRKPLLNKTTDSAPNHLLVGGKRWFGINGSCSHIGRPYQPTGIAHFMDPGGGGGALSGPRTSQGKALDEALVRVWVSYNISPT